MKSKLAAAALLLLPALLPVPGFARGGAAASPQTLDDAVAGLVAASGLRPSTVSVAVVDPRDGTLLAGHRAAESMLPASCLKVATTAAAMVALGPDFPLCTRLLAVPPGRGGDPTTVPGDLWLMGYGDPGFSEHGPEGGTLAALDAFVGQVLGKGVRTVGGDLVFDASYFAGPRVHPSWTDAGASARWYAAEVDALTVNDACLDVAAEPGGGPGDPARLSILPETGIVTLVNRVETTGSRADHDIGFRLAAEGNTLEVFGKVGARTSGTRSPAAIHDPALLCAEQVGRALARAGIRVAGFVRRPREGERPPEGASLLAEHRTPLSLACAVANTRSQNLWAETVLRVLGAEKGGEGSFAGGTRAVREVLSAAGPEVGVGLRPVDGSGLSRENRASAVALAKVLGFVWRSRAQEAFFGGLARPGEGTLERRFREKRFDGRVVAKTGTLRSVSGLCGLATGADGRPFCFAVLGEHVDTGKARLLQEGVVGALVGGGR